MSFCWTADQVFRMLNAYRVLETLDERKQGRFVAELQSLIVHISFENLNDDTGRMLMDSPPNYVDETLNQNIERVNVLRPVQEQPIPLPFYTCGYCKVIVVKPEMIDVGLDPIIFDVVSDLPSPSITGSGMSIRSVSESSLSGISPPVSFSTPVIRVASCSGVTPPSKNSSNSNKSRGAIPKLIADKKYVALPYLAREVALSNAAMLAKDLGSSKNGLLWHDAREVVRGCWNCSGPHRKGECPEKRGTFCGSCGYPGIPGDMCPLCYPKRAWGLSPPSWYRGAKKDDLPKE